VVGCSRQATRGEDDRRGYWKILARVGGVRFAVGANTCGRALPRASEPLTRTDLPSQNFHPSASFAEERHLHSVGALSVKQQLGRMPHNIILRPVVDVAHRQRRGYWEE
jgi:hypothetical protein